jgi:hypothetical protein
VSTYRRKAICRFYSTIAFDTMTLAPGAVSAWKICSSCRQSCRLANGSDFGGEWARRPRTSPVRTLYRVLLPYLHVAAVSGGGVSVTGSQTNVSKTFLKTNPSQLAKEPSMYSQPTLSRHRGFLPSARTGDRRRAPPKLKLPPRLVRTPSAAAAGDDWFSLEDYEQKHGGRKVNTGGNSNTSNASNAPDAPVVDVDIPSASSSDLVSALLSIVGSTSDGSKDASLTAAETDAVVDILNRLEEIGASAERRPLGDPLIYGNYNVSYTLMGNRQYGQPAGGRFRTGLGALLFKTRGLYQSVLRPDIVVNKVALDIFRILPSYVGLRGKLVEVPEEDGSKAGDTVKVFFEPPVLGFPFGIVARIGPPSTVVLKTTYVDERVRIGKGSRGSLFVFTRGGAADKASMETVGLERTSVFGKAIIALFTLGLLTVGGLVCYTGYLQNQAALSAIGWVIAMVGLFLAGTFVRGGIVDPGADDRPDVTLPGGDREDAKTWIARWREKNAA